MVSGDAGGGTATAGDVASAPLAAPAPSAGAAAVSAGDALVAALVGGDGGGGDAGSTPTSFITYRPVLQQAQCSGSDGRAGHASKRCTQWVRNQLTHRSGNTIDTEKRVVLETGIALLVCATLTMSRSVVSGKPWTATSAAGTRVCPWYSLMSLWPPAFQNTRSRKGQADGVLEAVAIACAWSWSGYRQKPQTGVDRQQKITNTSDSDALVAPTLKAHRCNNHASRHDHHCSPAVIDASISTNNHASLLASAALPLGSDGVCRGGLICAASAGHGVGGGRRIASRRRRAVHPLQLG